MLEQLNDYDWEEVFGEGSGGNCTPIKPQPAPGFDGSTETFRREDVKNILGMSEGERDERDWVVYGQLTDRRFFVARGGCDYTGWDCHASNSGDVAATEEDIIKFGLSADERTRFNLQVVL